MLTTDPCALYYRAYCARDSRLRSIVATAKTRPAEVVAAPPVVELAPVPPPAVAPAPEPKTERLMKVCGTCQHWRPQHLDQTIGQCVISAKALSAPLVTLDLQACSKWTVHQR